MSALGGKAAARDVPFMRQSEVCRFLDGGTVHALDLPYRAGELSMVVFLSRAIDGLADFERSLTAARVTDWVAQMTPHYVDIALPRFKVTATYALKQPLADLGMSSAFSPVKANFSGMVKGSGSFSPWWLTRRTWT